MKNRIPLHIEENHELKLKLLKELFNGSDFEVELITKEIESMSGNKVIQRWIRIGKKDNG